MAQSKANRTSSASPAGDQATAKHPHGPSDTLHGPVVEQSTVCPNLDGLWSCATIRRDPNNSLRAAAQKVQGGLTLLALTFSWCFGVGAPFFIAHSLYYARQSQAHAIAATLLCTVVISPYLINFGPSAWVTRLWLCASYYFDGGCTFSFEKKREPNTIPSQGSDGRDGGGVLQCYHPHGIFTLGVILNSGLRSTAAYDDPSSPLWTTYIGEGVGLIPKVGLAASLLVKLPIFNLIMVQMTGCIEAANKAHMVKKMKRGDSFGLLPGGFHEAALHLQGKERVYLKKKGFIHYALRYGYKVVPAYTFGESETYYNVPGFDRFRMMMSDLGIPTILVTGPLFFVPFLSLLPFSNCGIHTIHGEGRQFPKIPNPTPAQVDEYHAWYCDALRDLFNRNKARFGVKGELEEL